MVDTSNPKCKIQIVLEAEFGKMIGKFMFSQDKNGNWVLGTTVGRKIGPATAAVDFQMTSLGPNFEVKAGSSVTVGNFEFIDIDIWIGAKGFGINIEIMNGADEVLAAAVGELGEK